MIRKIGKFLAFAVGALIVLAIAAFIWSALPIGSANGKPDAAVEALNARSDGDIDYTSDWFEHEGNALHYVSAGEGETIVFLHGFPSFWMSHIRQMDAFKSDYRVVSIDGLGVGLSDAPSGVENYELEAMAEHVAALIDHLGADQVHLVGHDWGSTFAMGFSQRYPERVKTVTGMSAPPQNVMLSLLQTSEVQKRASEYVELLKGANPVLLVLLRARQRVYEGAYAPMVEAGHLSEEEGQLFRKAVARTKRLNAHINWYRANIPAPDDIVEDAFWPSREAKITVPALFIWGTDDPIINEDTIAGLRGAAENLTELSVENIGHWPHVERHEMVTAAIRDLLTGDGN